CIASCCHRLLPSSSTSPSTIPPSSFSIITSPSLFFFFLYFFLPSLSTFSSFTLPINFIKLYSCPLSFLFLSPLYQPITYPSVSKSLDSIPFVYFFHFSYLNRTSSTSFISCCRKPSSFIFLILLLSGDVEINPSPDPSSSTSLNLSNPNIRS